MTYKGYFINKLFPSGYYEVYMNGRFMKFDVLKDAKRAIDNIT